MSATEQGLADQLRELAERPEMMTAAHLAIENELIEMRDSGIFIGPHANGLAVKNKDGSPSPVIRMGTRMAIQMILRVLADQVEREGRA
jgi:hypothetical protein